MGTNSPYPPKSNACVMLPYYYGPVKGRCRGGGVLAGGGADTVEVGGGGWKRCSGGRGRAAGMSNVGGMQRARLVRMRRERSSDFSGDDDNHVRAGLAAC
uniref:Uncharacterized protein n=1 Tax=Oryza sativa subsp. japonica TaxID=39947 RepID=Q84J84_ORYSJ|nr:hypothetical protein [Oryza sativa Japonica Group]AAO37982.1 hypothetical protein [Oryza sativa Japonica Group]